MYCTILDIEKKFLVIKKIETLCTKNVMYNTGHWKKFFSRIDSCVNNDTTVYSINLYLAHTTCFMNVTYY